MKLLLPSLMSLALALPADVPAAPAGKQASARIKRSAPRKPPRRVPQVRTEAVDLTQLPAVSDFADEISLRHGFPRAELGALMAQIRYAHAAVQLVKPGPPGKPKNMNGVRARNIEPVRIGAGVRFWNENAALLARAEAQFGVPAEIIIGIIGIETVYGRNTGSFRVLDVLATLAFAYPEAPNRAARMAFFRGELENALVLARVNGIDPFSLLGSFAGAIGVPQFMPGSVLAWGVDYDNDGRVDLRGSNSDVVASVANFLVQHGWKREHTGAPVIGARVRGGSEWRRFLDQGLSARFRPEELLSAGVTASQPPPADRLYGLVDLQNGDDAPEYWLASDNFFSITKYNRSYYYAMSVIELGNAVKAKRLDASVNPRETL